MLSVFDYGPPAPCPAPFNLAAHVLGRAAARPDRLALSVLSEHASEDWSFAALETAVRGTGTVWLQSLPFSRMADRVLKNAPSAGGHSKGEGSPLGALFRMLSGD